MLYSIGYQGIEVATLIEALKTRDITILVDVRSKPFSRKPGFSKKVLKEALEKAGIDYRWLGEALGGFADILEEDIRGLARWQKKYSACLMCFERDPKTCHRDYEIAERLAKYDVSVEHIILPM